MLVFSYILGNCHCRNLINMRRNILFWCLSPQQNLEFYVYICRQIKAFLPSFQISMLLYRNVVDGILARKKSPICKPEMFCQITISFYESFYFRTTINYHVKNSFFGSNRITWIVRRCHDDTTYCSSPGFVNPQIHLAVKRIWRYLPFAVILLFTIAALGSRIGLIFGHE